MRPRTLVLLLAVAILSGWWLAPPPPPTGLAGETDHILLPDRVSGFLPAATAPALQALYRREAWSAVAPPAAGQGDRQAKAAERQAAPPPEGLDRFTLVGIIRVQGRPAEALLLDARRDTAQGRPREFRTREGQTLRDSGVLLERIEGTRVKLTHEGDSRWLELFQRGESQTLQAEKLTFN